MPLTRQHCSKLQVLPLPTGDEILELNGESMGGLTHQDALQKFKVICCYQDVGLQAKEPRSQHHLLSFHCTNSHQLVLAQGQREPCLRIERSGLLRGAFQLLKVYSCFKMHVFILLFTNCS